LLHRAVKRGDGGLIVALLRRGSPVDEADETGQTPLLTAVEKGAVEVVSLLLEAGASVHVGNARRCGARSHRS
jgi:ankyrin repeat protein